MASRKECHSSTNQLPPKMDFASFSHYFSFYLPYSDATCNTVLPRSSLENTVTADGSCRFLAENKDYNKKFAIVANYRKEKTIEAVIKKTGSEN